MRRRTTIKFSFSSIISLYIRQVRILLFYIERLIIEDNIISHVYIYIYIRIDISRSGENIIAKHVQLATKKKREEAACSETKSISEEEKKKREREKKRSGN